MGQRDGLLEDEVEDALLGEPDLWMRGDECGGVRAYLQGKYKAMWLDVHN